MLKNLKHSILFILIVLMLLLIVAVTLAASKPASPIEVKGISIPVDPIISGKWSGLGIGGIYSSTQAQVLTYLDTLIANGFTEFRTAIPDYTMTGWVDDSKWVQQQVIAKGGKSIWGVCSGSTAITSTSWIAFRAAILSAAAWAQANGVFEFQLGNEDEYKVDGTTMTVARLIANLKSTATEVQAIFTRGNVSYTCWSTHIDDWIAAGKGDIDILASNIYMTWGPHPYDLPWQDEIDALIGAFGVNGTYITEFGPNTERLDYYSADEAVQAAAVATMIDYIKASGTTRALYFCWKDGGYNWGILKADGTYRLLWNVLSGSGTSTSAPNIALSPASKDFGSVDISSAANPGQTFTIQNTGSANLTVGTVTITGTDAGQFVKSGDSASGQTIAAGASKTITVTFDPSAVGAKTASMSIPSNDPDMPTLAASLSGNGTTAPDTTTPDTTAPDTTTPDTTAPDTTTPNTSVPVNTNNGGTYTSQTTPQESNPVRAFTTRFYKLCLSRDPDGAGLNGWVNGLKTGAITGAKVAYGFVFSDEFIKRNVSNEEYLTILYRAFFNREPDSGGYNGWLASLNAGKSRKSVLAGFINSQEFKNLCAAYGIKPGSI